MTPPLKPKTPMIMGVIAAVVVNGKAAESACPADTGLALVHPEPGETVGLAKVS